MFNFLKNIFSNSSKIPESITKEFTEKEHDIDYELKTEGLERVLGKMHDLVGHAIIPFGAGGAVDMYYFPNHIKGTGFATMELLEPDGSGPLPNRLGTYELVAFTKLGLVTEEFEILGGDIEENNISTHYNSIERHLCGILSDIGHFSKMATLNPNETCELPNEEGEPNNYIIFDLYEPEGKKFTVGSREHHLLLCMEIYESEMHFARKHGSVELFKKLKAAEYYPYSDLDRLPVV